jgi:hypothetical protein
MIRRAYLDAATSAAALVTDPAVVVAWSAPSSLALMSVGGLAAHLASQVVSAARTLDGPPPDVEAVTLTEHYARVKWLGADLDQEANVAIRNGSESAAGNGPDQVAAAAAEALAALSTRLMDQPIDQRVRVPSGPWSLTLDDFLVTRMMEIAVHSDDLAASVGIRTPELPESVTTPVLDLLVRLSARRHGPTAVLRALSRSERAPESISAF